MGIDAWITIGVLSTVIALLMFSRYAPDMVLLGGLATLMVVPFPTDAGWQVGVMTVEQSVAGFANPGLLAVAVLFVVAEALRETGALGWIVQRVLGRPSSVLRAQLRMMTPVLGMSAFLNNTPVVAMFIPVVTDWARKLSISPSKLLIPLSYAAMLGGVCTLIGTSTNLVVSGMLASETDHAPLGMFEISWVGIPCALVGLGYLGIFGRRLLPERKPPINLTDDPRQYTVEMIVEEGSNLVGRTIEEAGLRQLPGTYLMEIDRDGRILAAVGPTEQLRANDRLVFVGVVDSVVDLQRIRGLVPATNQVFKLDAPRSERCLIEAVVSNSCPGVGQSIRESRFRSSYNAVVIAVARNGERMKQKIGDIVLRAGDTLLLETSPTFIEQQRDNRDFYLVSEVTDSRPVLHERAWIAIGVLVLMVAAVTTGIVSMLQGAMVAAGLMVVTGCVRAGDARRSIDWSLLLVIAASFGIGKAMQETGAAASIAHTLIALAGDNPLIALAVVYIVTAVFTELITNNAAAVLMFPIALATAADLGDGGVSYMPFIIAIMVAASAAFATPLGYQTNLMVYGPGGYRFTDYIRIGLPLNLLMGVTTLIVAPIVWPF